MRMKNHENKSCETTINEKTPKKKKIEVIIEKFKLMLKHRASKEDRILNLKSVLVLLSYLRK